MCDRPGNSSGAGRQHGRNVCLLCGLRYRLYRRQFVAVGGQNLIEACAVGKPVLIGPHTWNFTQASQLAVASGAAVRVHDAAELAQTLPYLLAHPDQMSKIGHAGQVFVSANRGATERALFHISKSLAVISSKITHHE
ncbi:MAG TPA: glycosyltransferase [Gallionella sp.]